jgi:hypothetical protein
MDEFAKSVFVGELQKQCQFALNAVGQVNFCLKKLNSQGLAQEERSYFHSEVFRGVHSFLTHASNVSKILWPGLPRREKNESDEHYKQRINGLKKVQRAIALRTELGLPEEHVLKSRKLRDHLEHFDQRLDDWEESSKHRNFVQDNIGPENAIVGVAKTDRMRNFDPVSKTFSFRGETFGLQDIATALDKLLPILVAKEAELRQKLTAK